MVKKEAVMGLVFVLMTVLALSGCGGSDPKALAKQTYDIGMEALGALFNPAKTAELEKKLEEIEKKVAKLSPANQTVYNEELARLAEAGLGDGLGSLFNAAGSALQNVDTEAAKDALDAAGQAADALKSLGF
jgi:hypothetical protein